MNSFKTPPSPCPYCGRVLDGATSLDTGIDKMPVGSFSVCAYCGHIMRLDEHMVLRKTTAKDFQELLSEPEQMAKVIAASIVIQQVNGQRRHRNN